MIYLGDGRPLCLRRRRLKKAGTESGKFLIDEITGAQNVKCVSNFRPTHDVRFSAPNPVFLRMILTKKNFPTG